MRARIVQLLEAGRAIINTPDRWTKGQNARDAEGKLALINGPRAVCWCSYGALYRATVDLRLSCAEWDRAAHILRQECRRRHRVGFVVFNDLPSTTHADLLALWDAAIERMKAMLEQGGAP